MKALETKTMIADALSQLCQERPLRKISVSDIIERTGKNRKTFYYHFEDKDALIAWKFHHDLAQLLETLPLQRPGTTLVYPEEGQVPENLLPFPYYTDPPDDGEALDQSAFFQTFDQVIEADPAFYGQALLEKGPGSLRTHLYELYLPAITRDIHRLLANRYLAQENIAYLADFFTTAFIYRHVSRFDRRGRLGKDADAGPFGNLVHTSLKTLLDDSQLRRNLG